MTLQVRRVVTGHKPDGKATVLIDDISKNRPPRDANNTVNETTVVWTTEGFPVNNDSRQRTAARARSASRRAAARCSASSPSGLATRT